MQNLVEIIQSSSFYEFSLILALCAAGGILANLLRQPLLVIFILIGILLGTSGLNIINSMEEVELFSKLGIAILLFIVGLKLDINLIKSLGVSAVIIGCGQIALTLILGGALAMLLGFAWLPALLIGVALSFSSTIIIIKVLSDKREIDSIYGRIALGVLIIQDFAVVIAMIVLAAAGAEEELEAFALLQNLGEVALYTIILLTLIWAFMKFGAEKFVGFISQSSELLLCVSIAWAVLLAAICDSLGLSKELGGLLAGISFASTQYREAIISRLMPLRDFMLLFFFVTLGLEIDLAQINDIILPALIMAAFVMVFKPLCIVALSGFLGYRKRTGFLAGISLGQISEFSLIFISMAFAQNLIEQDVLGLITLVAIITIVLSTYMISMSQKLYSLAEPALGIFERKNSNLEQSFNQSDEKQKYDVILFGLGRFGQAIAKGLIEKNKKVLGVDFDPEELKRWCKVTKADAVFGDASDPEFFQTLPLGKAKWVISALPQHNTGLTHQDPRLIIIHALKDTPFKGKVAVASHSRETEKIMEKHGIDVILLPFQDAADRAVTRILEAEQTKKSGAK